MDRENLAKAFRLGYIAAEAVHGVEANTNAELFDLLRYYLAYLQKIASGEITTYGSPEEIVGPNVGSEMHEVLRRNRESERALAAEILNHLSPPRSDDNP